MSKPSHDRAGSVRTEVHAGSETMLDPAARSLNQVRFEHAGEADTIFETRIRDLVEPRREFIEGNALKVVNLDV